jgi:hypothetical protein
VKTAEQVRHLMIRRLVDKQLGCAGLIMTMMKLDHVRCLSGTRRTGADF